MAITVAIGVGFGFAGAPLVGWVAAHLGPRWALLLGAASGFAASSLAVHFLWRHYRLEVGFVKWRFTVRAISREPGGTP